MLRAGILALLLASSNPCVDFDALYADIRDARITHASARERLQALLPLVRDYFYAHGGKDAPRDAWRFPLQGYRADGRKPISIIAPIKN